MTSPAALAAALKNSSWLAVAFAGSGVMLGSWASRIPAVTERLGLTWGALGGVMFVSAAGSFAMLQASPRLVDRLGTARAARAFSLLSLAGLAGVGLASVAAAASQPAGIATLFVSLSALGCGLAVWDVAMNVEGAAADRREGVAVLLPLHGCYSLGAAAGAVGGAAMSWLDVAPLTHLGPVAVVLALVERRAAKAFEVSPLPDPADGPAVGRGTDQQRRRYLGFGLVALLAALAEVVGSDWIALLVVDDLHTEHWAAGVAVGVFLAAMALGRGVAVLIVRPSWGLLRTSLVLCVVGMLLVVLPAVWRTPVPAVVFVLVGATVWGLGAAASLPWAMHEAGRDPRFAASRVRTVQAVSNLAFLSPALVGWTAAHAGHVPAFLTVVVLEGVLAVAAVVTLGTYQAAISSRTAAAAGRVESIATMLAQGLNGRIRSIETFRHRGVAEPSAVGDEPIGGVGASVWSARLRGRLRHRPRPGHP